MKPIIVSSVTVAQEKSWAPSHYLGKQNDILKTLAKRQAQVLRWQRLVAETEQDLLDENARMQKLQGIL